MSNFNLFIKNLQSGMPYIAAAAVLFAYFASGKIHADILLIISPKIGVINSYLIGYGIAIVACIVVYFPIMDEGNPDIGKKGEIAAIIFGVTRIAGILYEGQIDDAISPTVYSLAILMGAACVIELYLLSSMKSVILNRCIETGTIDGMIKNQQKILQAKRALMDIRATNAGLAPSYGAPPLPHHNAPANVPANSHALPNLDGSFFRFDDIPANGNGL